MKKLLLLLLLPVCVLGQDGYVKVGLGLRIEPFYPYNEKGEAEEFNDFYLNPSFLQELSVGYLHDGKLFTELSYQYFLFDGVNKIPPSAILPENYPVYYFYYKHTITSYFGVRRNKLALSLGLAYSRLSYSRLEWQNTKRLLPWDFEITPRISYTLLKINDLNFVFEIKPVQFNYSNGLVFNSIIMLSLSHNISRK